MFSTDISSILHPHIRIDSRFDTNNKTESDLILHTHRSLLTKNQEYLIF